MQPEKGVTIKANGVNRFGGKIDNQVTKSGTSIGNINQLVPMKNEFNYEDNHYSIDKSDKFEKSEKYNQHNQKHNLPPIHKKSFQSSNNIDINPIKMNDFKQSIKPKDQNIKINQRQMNKVFNDEDDDNNDSYNENTINQHDQYNQYNQHDQHNQHQHHHQHSQDIFKNRTEKEDYEEKYMNDINEFNANLMKNQNWGSGSVPHVNRTNPVVGRLPLKPTKKKMENELGNHLK